LVRVSSLYAGVGRSGTILGLVIAPLPQVDVQISSYKITSPIEDGMGIFTAMRKSFRECLRGRGKFLVLLAGATVILTSCGGSSSSSSGSSAPPTASLTATPSTITAGQSSNLTFSSTNATTGTIDNNIGTVGIASQGAGIQVSPTSTTTYQYTVTGPGGTVTASATITVNAAPPPPTVSLSVSPANGIVAGGSVTLTWTSNSSTSYVVINTNVGASPGRVGASGTNYSVPSPTQTTIYSAVAVTATGQQSAPANATLTVNPITSFQGMDASQAEGGTLEDDIDPIGAIGTKQFLEYTNTSYQGYDKVTFTPVWPAPVNLGTPWPTGTHCAGPQIQLDAHVIFDRFANRWVIGAKTTVQGQGGYYFCIAVSNTDDLTSTNPPFAWYAYAFRLDPYLENIAGTITYLPDWPKVATWPEPNNPAYFAAMDTVNNANQVQTENGVLVCAFDRANMLLGVAQASLKPMLCYQVKGPDAGGYLAHSLIPADVDGPTAPPAGRDEFMVSIQNPPLDGVSITSSTLNLWDFQLDWSTASLMLVGGQPASVSVDSYQPGCYTASNPAQTTCVQEPPVAALGGGLEVDSVGDRLMPRFAYRNFGTYESFLVSHTVQSPANGQIGQDARQTGIRWYELLGDGSGTGTPTVHQQGTITPDITTFRFLPSIAQDKMGNVAVGYSVSDPQTNPGISASYWNLNDPNGPFSAPVEISLLDGTSESEEIPYNFVPPNVGTTNLGKWGSYSSMTVDPVDDCTFWYVNEYWPTNNATGDPATWSTNISNFQIPGCQ
jgi:hypothetical protein